MLRSSLVLTVILALAAPAAASASTASLDLYDGRIHVTAAPGEVNAVRITREDIALPVGVWDTVVTATSCSPVTSGYVRCGGGSPVVRLGDRDDSLVYSDDTADYPIGPADVEGGPGDDTITTAMSADEVDGGEGKDTINAFVGDDVVDGGAGDDTVNGDHGADTVTGGPGEDLILGGSDDDVLKARDGEHDRVRCNDGTDTVEADRADEVHADCEHVSLPAEEKPGGGSGDGSGGGSGGGAGGGAGSGGSTPAPGPGGIVAPGTPTGPRVDGLPVLRTPDRLAPRLQVVRKQRRRGVTTLTIRCDEACTVTAKAGRRKVSRTLLAGRPGRLKLRGRTIALTARDAAGNVARKTVR
jgi:uncharacterized membrane protein YgcG